VPLGNHGAQVIMLARRFVTFTKMLVVGAGAATALCIAAIASLQFGFWFTMKTWSAFPVARIFELLQIDTPRRYIPASIDISSSPLGPQHVIEWMLDLPAVVVLLAALALLALFYASLTSVEKWLLGGETANS
jgi:hypothetical protein